MTARLGQSLVARTLDHKHRTDCSSVRACMTMESMGIEAPDRHLLL